MKNQNNYQEIIMNQESIDAARNRFDRQLHTDEYKKIHSDNDQLEKIIELSDIQHGKNYLDLGTGNGYIAFQLAKQFSEITIHGLDIATNTINQNNSIVKQNNIQNIHFEIYDGYNYPYPDKFFYGVFSRYAFHHFPDPNKSIENIHRILEQNGFFLLSDPLTYDDDDISFVDQFQSLISDGHVHFYRKGEIEKIFSNYNFKIEKQFESFVRYPRVMNNKYDELFSQTPDSILNKYKIEKEADKVFISVKVMNILFRKYE